MYLFLKTPVVIQELLAKYVHNDLWIALYICMQYNTNLKRPESVLFLLKIIQCIYVKSDHHAED